MDRTGKHRSRRLYSASYLNDSLAIRMGGRAAEGIVFGELSTGAADDLAGATELATRMVRELGMSTALGPVAFGSGNPTFLGGEEVTSRPYAQATQQLIDREVGAMLRAAEQRTVAVLTGRRTALDHLTQVLLERETVDGAEVDRILGQPLEPVATANGYRVNRQLWEDG
jgi:cell division protease FtsH